MAVTKLTARKLRIVLIVAFISSVLVVIGGFYQVQYMLREYATTISSLNAKADATGRNLQTFRKLEETLNQQSEAIAKADDIVAESKEYVYQDKIIEDILSIAKKSNVTVTSFNFSETTAGSTAPSTPSTATPAPAPQVATPGSINSKEVSVSIKSPLKYTEVMNFIQRIEKNSLKMQISNISMTKSSDKPGSIASDNFTIKVYVR